MKFSTAENFCNCAEFFTIQQCWITMVYIIFSTFTGFFLFQHLYIFSTAESSNNGVHSIQYLCWKIIAQCRAIQQCWMSMYTLESRGKGGRKLVVSGNKFQEKKLTPEETAELKRDWRRFLEEYKAELSKILEKDPLSDKFPCNNCDKLVTRQGYIRHLTLQGCSAMKPEVKWGNYVKIFSNKFV